MGWAADDPDDPLMIPGPRGATGPAGGGGGSASWTAIVQNLGVGNCSGTFDVTGLSGLTPGNVVALVQTLAQVSSRGNARDEAEFDRVSASGYVLDAATIRVIWSASGIIVGDVSLAYQVSA
jgi:hypothetical protein